MKKVSILMSDMKKNDAILALRNVGVLHVKHYRVPKAEDIDSLKSKIALLEKAVHILVPSKTDLSGNVQESDCLCNAKKVLKLNDKRKEFSEKIHDLQNKIQIFKPWGTISGQDIECLQENGVYVKLYTCRKKDLSKIPEQFFSKVIKTEKNTCFIVVISEGKDIELPFEEVKLHGKSMEELNNEISNIEAARDLNEKTLSDLSVYRSLFERKINEYLKLLELEDVRFGMGDETAFAFVQGYCPENKIKSLRKISKEHKLGLLVEEPENIDEAPTLLKNSFFGRISEPIFNFMGATPGYSEFDVSVVFLAFFSIFFAMLIGDAGYGLLFLTAVFLLRRKFPLAPKEPFQLFYILSAATVVEGAVTGNWFGVEQITHIPFFNHLIINNLNSYIESNQLYVIKLCFTIGVLHLTLAHAMVAVRFINSLRALGQIGWILILWGVYFLAGTLVLAKEFPGFAVWFFVAGSILVLLFANYDKKNFVKGIITSLTNFPLSVISAFSDVVSYLRLFAVGYASVTVAASFNEMAVAVGMNSVVRTLSFAIILLFGHSLNIILGGMAVIVHGIRLNMLEFSSHLGMQWSGTKYKPFKE